MLRMAIVNLYTAGARLGLHQDAEEPEAPSSRSASACLRSVWRASTAARVRSRMSRCSGDLVVFGGPNRRTYHGVPRY
jgi:alkylated DNA repair protein (DNA oxidative demethylase)